MSEHKEVKYEGWGAFDKTSIQGNFKWFEYEPKTFCEDDIECESTFSLVHTSGHVTDVLSQNPILWSLC
jgi:hypothetical protein